MIKCEEYYCSHPSKESMSSCNMIIKMSRDKCLYSTTPSEGDANIQCNSSFLTRLVGVVDFASLAIALQILKRQCQNAERACFGSRITKGS